MPFAIVDNVPLSMTLGYGSAGRAEPGEQYLAYCKANGTFRTRSFPVPSLLTVSNSLNQVFNSAAWKALKWKDEGLGWSYTLDENYTKTKLWKQVENMANESLQRMPR